MPRLGMSKEVLEVGCDTYNHKLFFGDERNESFINHIVNDNITFKTLQGFKFFCIF